MDSLQATLGEFMAVWRMGGDASIHLSTSRGLLSMSSNMLLGNPGAHFPPPTMPPYSPPSPPPSPPPTRRPRNRGPARRERDRQRAARFQARRPPPTTPPASPSTPPSTAPVGATSTPATAPVAPPFLPPPATTAPPAPGEAGQQPDTDLPPAPQDWESTTLPQGVGVRLTRAPSIPQLDGAAEAPSTPSTPSSSPRSTTTTTSLPPGTNFNSAIYHPPSNLPPPPSCTGCGASTSWSQSGKGQDSSWTHWFLCLSGCLPPTCDYRITSPPASVDPPARLPPVNLDW